MKLRNNLNNRVKEVLGKQICCLMRSSDLFMKNEWLQVLYKKYHHRLLADLWLNLLSLDSKWFNIIKVILFWLWVIIWTLYLHLLILILKSLNLIYSNISKICNLLQTIADLKQNHQIELLEEKLQSKL